MWLLSLLPDSLLYGFILSIMGIGAALFVFGTFAVFLPLVKGWGFVMRTIGTVLLIGSVYLYGGYGTEMKWRARAEEMQKKLDEASNKSKEMTAQLQKKLNAQTLLIKQKAKDNANAIKKHAEKIDADCKLTNTVIELHNTAASESGVSGTSKGTNGELPESSNSTRDIKVK